jgi:hypothetical protein
MGRIGTKSADVVTCWADTAHLGRFPARNKTLCRRDSRKHVTLLHFACRPSFFSLEETVASIWVWLKLVWLERTKVWEELLSVSQFSTDPSTFNKCKQKSGASEKRDGNYHVFCRYCWEILSSLLLADGCYLGIFQWFSNTFLRIA